VSRQSAPVALGLTLLSACLFALAFPPLRLRPLAWLALAPFLVALAGASLRRTILLGWAWGVVAAFLVGLWFPRAVSEYYQQPPLVVAAFFVGVTSTMVAPYTIAFALAYRGLRQRGAASPLLVAAAWTAAEFGRGRLFTGTPFFIGNPWALLGYSQVGWTPLMQIAAVTGIYGVTFVLAAANAAIADLWLGRRDGAPRGRRASVLAAAAAASVALVYGVVALRAVPADTAGDPGVRVAVVQHNRDLGPQWDSRFFGQNLDVYLRATWDVIRTTQPAVVFWPEGVMTFFLEEEPLYRQAIARVLRPAAVQLVAGGPAMNGADPPRYLNSVFLLSPDGVALGRYDKQYLVPFAEYFPIAGLDLLRRRFERVRVFTPGREMPPLPTAAGPAGILICNEAMLPEVASQRVAEGAAYLVNPSNDTWLDDQMYSNLQFDIVATRAIEQRRYLVRASTSGPSAIVDPWGRVEARTAPLTSGVLSGIVRPATGRSVYGRIGDAFAMACVVAVAGVLGVRKARRREGLGTAPSDAESVRAGGAAAPITSRSSRDA
jgi:apolipoprotein N-acyltransferase